MSWTRRRFLTLAGGAAGGLVVGCGGGGGTAVPDGGGAPPKPCSAPSAGPGANYCLIENRELHVPGGAKLAVGQVALFNLDDNSAAIVARDAGGFYALSGICTHSCCLLTLCGDGACASPITNPGNCAVTKAASLQQKGSAFLCSCHGSQFAADGTVITGPAQRSLPAFAIRIDGEDLFVDLGRVAVITDRV